MEHFLPVPLRSGSERVIIFLGTNTRWGEATCRRSEPPGHERSPFGYLRGQSHYVACEEHPGTETIRTLHLANPKSLKEELGKWSQGVRISINR